MTTIEEHRRVWAARLEKDGFNVAKKNIHFGEYGASFSGKVDVIRFLNAFDPNGEKYPRVKETFKDDKFSVDIIDDPDNCFPMAMQVHLENSIDDKKSEDDEDIKDMAAGIIEGGDLVDKVAEIGDWILTEARNKAKEIHMDMKKEE